MLHIVAGISLKCLKPRVWDTTSPHYLPDLQAVMVSYADFHKMPLQRRKAMEHGIHEALGIPKNVKVYLDNGAFYFLNREGEMSQQDYEEFVTRAEPDWRPIPQDFIPTPKMTYDEQQSCFQRTMRVNEAYQHDGYVPVIHVGQFLEDYISAVCAHDRLASKPAIALGGIVPNLLRVSKAMPYRDVLKNLRRVREEFAGKHIHVFGIGGTATLHVAALLGIDSVDSSGWRNRAARGIIQLPGSGERMVAELGSWRGRQLSSKELEKLEACPCPACRQFGIQGLRENKSAGFCNRATHNLWILLNEAQLIEQHIVAKTYREWYKNHLDNTIYRPLIDQLVDEQSDNFGKT